MKIGPCTLISGGPLRQACSQAHFGVQQRKNEEEYEPYVRETVQGHSRPGPVQGGLSNWYQDAHRQGYYEARREWVASQSLSGSTAEGTQGEAVPPMFGEGQPLAGGPLPLCAPLAPACGELARLTCLLRTLPPASKGGHKNTYSYSADNVYYLPC